MLSVRKRKVSYSITFSTGTQNHLGYYSNQCMIPYYQIQRISCVYFIFSLWKYYFSRKLQRFHQTPRPHPRAEDKNG